MFEVCSPGEQSVREANAARFKQTCQREFEAFKKERLATGELECQKLITAAQSHLTHVCPPSRVISVPLMPLQTPACSTVLQRRGRAGNGIVDHQPASQSTYMS